MMGTLVGFQPTLRERPAVDRSDRDDAPACKTKAASHTAISTGPRSLLSELLSAALEAEQRDASGSGMPSSTTHNGGNNPGCCTVAGDWMDEDGSDAESDEDSDESSGEEEDACASYFLFEELELHRSMPMAIPPPGRSNHARLQAALAQAQLAQLLHAQAMHQERVAEDMARAAAVVNQQQQAQVFLAQQEQPSTNC
ncbi:hypothetical protein DUNSADRAFT_5738 [Dunaliella salina]|uniref:Encoded protein n=1 Tax=Dunaliella salina TaxID=3046 RepID=A0ABQ7H731_DUNSA|nr:hypothetical protein DUNSADRAFT_5738 [Dunaliella salina]|eukprot:KAF5842662.1 hypothetical protein DUNSADRAFT_5738 [Dunaliella salina]